MYWTLSEISTYIIYYLYFPFYTNFLIYWNQNMPVFPKLDFQGKYFWFNHKTPWQSYKSYLNKLTRYLFTPHYKSSPWHPGLHLLPSWQYYWYASYIDSSISVANVNYGIYCSYCSHVWIISQQFQTEKWMICIFNYLNLAQWLVSNRHY